MTKGFHMETSQGMADAKEAKELNCERQLLLSRKQLRKKQRLQLLLGVILKLKTLTQWTSLPTSFSQSRTQMKKSLSIKMRTMKTMIKRGAIASKPQILRISMETKHSKRTINMKHIITQKNMIKKTCSFQRESMTRTTFKTNRNLQTIKTQIVKITVTSSFQISKTILNWKTPKKRILLTNKKRKLTLTKKKRFK